jgi:TPR repeat protein
MSRRRSILAVGIALAAVACGGFAVRAWLRRPVVRCDGREACAVACDHGDDEGCTGLALAYWDARGGKRDLAAAEATLLRACNEKTAAGCDMLANLYREAKGFEAKAPQAPALRVRAIAHYDARCRAGDGRACVSVGRLVTNESWPDRDAARAEEAYRIALPLLQRGCDGRDARPCATLSGVYGYALGVPRDVARSYDVLRRACELGDRRACRDAGSTYGHGRDELPANQALAADLRRRGCELGDATACWTLGFAYERGEGLAKDEVRSAEYYRRACDMDYPDGCRSLESAYEFQRGVRRDDAKRKTAGARARELGEKACANDTVSECEWIGIDDASRREAMAARVRQILQEGCDAGFASDCSDLSKRVEKTDVAASQAASDRACALGWSSSCSDAGAKQPDAGP